MITNFEGEDDQGLRFFRYLRIDTSDLDEMSGKNNTAGSDKEDEKDFLIEGTAINHELVGNGVMAANQNIPQYPDL